MHDDNCFITLTYDNENLPQNKSLDKREWQTFMKRLRKELQPQKIRFFACGEYGKNQDITTLDTIGRPHYHAIIFGHDLRERLPNERLNEKYLISEENGHKLYTSPTLEKVWPKGFNTVGDCTFESAAYVARYCLKKITGESAVDYYAGRIPEFATQSRRPGIAYTWFVKYRKDLDKGFITSKGVKLPSAKYYNDLYEKLYSDDFTFIKEKKRQSMDVLDPEMGTDRLKIKEIIKCKRIKQLKRQLQ